MFSGASCAATDLVVGNVSVSHSGSPGGKITINTTIKNNGTTKSSGFYVGHYRIDEKAVNPNIAGQETPKIYGDIVVWADYRNDKSTSIATTNRDIFMKNLSTGKITQITNDPADQRNPDIYGNLIVWEDMRSGFSEIYGYDLRTQQETRIVGGTGGNIFNPSISNNVLVCYAGQWICLPLGNSPTTVFASDGNPKIDGSTNRICYQKGTDLILQTFNGMDVHVMYTKVATITDTSIKQYDSYGDNVVWVDKVNNNYNLFLKNIVTGIQTQITNYVTASSNFYPSIYENKVVYVYNNHTIYMIF